MKQLNNRMDGKIMELFAKPFPFDDFFLYVSNHVSVDKTLGVMGILSPKFLEVDGCIMWENVESIDYSEGRQKFTDATVKERERYYNLFCIEDFFLVGEEVSDCVTETAEEGWRKYMDLKLAFARQIERYWRFALSECYPGRRFEFEISEKGIWPEDGACLTFWQVNE